MCEVKKYHNTSNTRIDECMRDFVEWLSIKHRVVACCCGHKKYPKTIIVKEIKKISVDMIKTFLQNSNQEN